MSSLPPVNPMNGPLDWNEDDYRDDFDRRYAGNGDRWEDHALAYRYGHEMSTNERYAGRDWDTAESEMRAGWEHHHPDSPWERFKASVQHAWQRMKGGGGTAGAYREGTRIEKSE